MIAKILPLIVASLELATGQPLLPWLKYWGFGVGEVSDELVEITALPHGWTASGSYWIYVRNQEGEIVADMDPDDGQMEVRKRFFIVENDDAS